MKVLFFSPHAAVWAHSFPEALVAEAIVQQGNEISYIGCAGLLGSHCVAMSAYGVPFQADALSKKQICRRCNKSKQIILENFGFDSLNLDDFVDASDLSQADELLSQVNPGNFLNFSMSGVGVGRIAAYELLLQAKKIDFVFKPEEWDRYLASLKNSILVLLGVGKIFSSVRPDRVVLYNALYSVNRIVCCLAEYYEIPQYFLHAGENLSNRHQTLMLDRGHNFAHYRYMRDTWISRQMIACSASEIKVVTEHFLEVIKGRSPWAYSLAPTGDEDELKKFFKVKGGQKIICATMSSYDELFAAEVIGVVPPCPGLVFPKQTDWIKALVDYVEKKPELYLIIRVHPREFPNKRESVLSAHAILLKEVLKNLPDNVCVNWPSDNVSLYDLANITDVFANAWSSAGEEMSLLGIPVVLYCPDFVLYPPNLNFVGTTEVEYFQQIEAALKSGWSAEILIKAYRWGAIKWGCATFFIAESFASASKRKMSFITRVIRKLRRISFPYSDLKIDCRNRKKVLSIAPIINRILEDKLNSILDIEQPLSKISVSTETACIKMEVGKLVDGLYGLTNNPAPGTLASKLRKFACYTRKSDS